MRTMIAVSMAGLIMVGATYAYAEMNTPDEASLDTPISTIHMDALGNITKMMFANGAVLEEPQLDPQEKVLQVAEIIDMRPLPCQFLQVSSPSGPAVVVLLGVVEDCPECRCVCCCYDRVRCCGRELEELSGREVVLHYNPEGQMVRIEPPGTEAWALDTSPEEQLLKDVDVLGYRSYTLIEYVDRSTGETRVGVLAP